MHGNRRTDHSDHLVIVVNGNIDTKVTLFGNDGFLCGDDIAFEDFRYDTVVRMHGSEQGFAVLIRQCRHDTVVSVEDAHFVVEGFFLILEERKLVHHPLVVTVKFPVLHMIDSVNGREVFCGNDRTSAQGLKHLLCGALSKNVHADQHEKSTHDEDGNQGKQRNLHKELLAVFLFLRSIRFFVYGLIGLFQNYEFSFSETVDGECFCLSKSR